LFAYIIVIGFSSVNHMKGSRPVYVEGVYNLPKIFVEEHLLRYFWIDLHSGNTGNVKIDDVLLKSMHDNAFEIFCAEIKMSWKRKWLQMICANNKRNSRLKVCVLPNDYVTIGFYG